MLCDYLDPVIIATAGEHGRCHYCNPIFLFPTTQAGNSFPIIVQSSDPPTPRPIKQYTTNISSRLATLTKSGTKRKSSFCLHFPKAQEILGQQTKEKTLYHAVLVTFIILCPERIHVGIDGRRQFIIPPSTT